MYALIARIVHPEQMLVRPYIGAVEREEDRNITHNLDIFFIRVTFKFFPLRKEDPLREKVAEKL